MDSKKQNIETKEHDEDHCEWRCKRCGEWIKRNNVVWVDSFPFGAACARRVLKEKKA